MEPSPVELEAVGHRLRAALLSCLHGPRTSIAELARDLDPAVSADELGTHLGILEAAGLVQRRVAASEGAADSTFAITERGVRLREFVVERPTWAQLDRLLDDIAERVIRDGAPDVIAAVARGGLIPSVGLSHRLGVRDLAVVYPSAAGGREHSSPRHTTGIIKITSAVSLSARHVLLVDDISATGRTLAAALDAIEAADPASLRSAACVVMTQRADNADPAEVARSAARLCYVGRRTNARGVALPWEQNPADMAQGR